MHKAKHILIVLCVLVGFLPAKATHIIGGELYYECLGNNEYRIVLKLYRDCFNGVPPFDDPAPLGVYTAVGGNLVQVVNMALPGSNVIPPQVSNPCLVAPPNVCVEEAIYEEIVTLPPTNGGYILVYQRCCRNNTILNINNPQEAGATYTAFIPGPGTFDCNSSPNFRYFPPVALCAGDPLVFDHSATDPDGDSLVYEFCDPYIGGTTADPAPNPPAAPPYDFVTFVPPYSASNPLGANPPLTLNQQTGLLTGTPNLLGQFVVGVCVSEYRNGLLITTTKRDFQFNVVQCLSDVTAVFANPNPDPQNSCTGFDISFTNTSLNSSSYLWNFGDPATTADTSTAFEPTYSYPGPGNYTVTLIANPGFVCADTATITFGVFPQLDAFYTAPEPQCITGNSFDFTAGGIFQNNTTFTWTFGPNANNNSSTQQNPQNVTYSAPGTYPVTLEYNGNGCTRTFVDSITVFPLATVDFDINQAQGCEPLFVQFSNSSTASGAPLIFEWDFGDGNGSNLPTPSHTYQNDGLYDVTLTAYSTAGCVDTLTLSFNDYVNVLPSPTAGINVTPVITDVLSPIVTVTDVSEGAISCDLWMGVGDTLVGECDVVYTYAQAGTYFVTQIVINEIGCPDTAMVPVIINPIYRFHAPNAFTPNGDDINDVFRIFGEGFRKFELLIFNRWGQQIFKSENQAVGWDGTYNSRSGERCPDDVYVWKAFTTDFLGVERNYIGKVVLIK